MKIGIIVLQTNESDRQLCREVMEKLGLRVGDHFLILDIPLTISRCWEPGQRQLLITGTFDGIHEGVREMVEEAQRINPELVCVSFSLEHIEGPFDHRIRKPAGAPVTVCEFELKSTIQRFLEGKLHRSPS